MVRQLGEHLLREQRKRHPKEIAREALACEGGGRERAVAV